MKTLKDMRNRTAAGMSAAPKGTPPQRLRPVQSRAQHPKQPDGSTQVQPAEVAPLEAEVVIDDAPRSGTFPTGRGMPPVVMCMAPADPSGNGNVYVADPPALDPYATGMRPGLSGPGYTPNPFVAGPDTSLAMTRGASPITYSFGAAVDAYDPTAPPDLRVRRPGEPSKEQFMARELLSNFDCARYVGTRHNWMIIVAPEVPVAGEECIILFNRLQSESLRVRPRIQLQYAFNGWQLQSDSGGNWCHDMGPAPMNRTEDSDFWWAKIKIPQNTFELNFVMTDTEGLYENNNMQDFMFPVVDGITREEWDKVQADMLKEKERQRLAEERKKAEEENRARLEKLAMERCSIEEQQKKKADEMRLKDLEKAKKRAEDMGRRYDDMKRKGMVMMRQGTKQDDATAPLVWCVEPAVPRAGDKVKVYYNRKATNLAGLTIPADKFLSLRWGNNGWQGPQVSEMKLCATKPAAVLALAPPPPPPVVEEPKPKEEDKAADAKTTDAKAADATDAKAADTKAAADAKEADAKAADAKAAAAKAAAAAPVKKEPPPPPPEEWWEADIEIPAEAAVMDFVINYYDHYDNNGRKDYAIKVELPEGQTMENWIAQLTEMYRLEEFETRVAAEQSARKLQLEKEERKRKAREAVLSVERRKVRHTLFTEPEIIKAGEEVTIWYSPQYTNLADKQQIFLMCGFNRWTHESPVGPLPMLPPDALPTFDENGEELTAYLVRSGSPTHWKATFVVPHDAYKMDFVFSDVSGGEGTYDNRGGYDYHLPVEGSPVKEPQLYCVHIAVEMAPIAKVGGLGDVVTSLGRAVQEQGHIVEVILPKYEFFNYSSVLAGKMNYETEFDWGGTRIVVSSCMVENLRVWFIEPRNQFFNTREVYGRYDDEVRFDFFCKAALEFLLRTDRQPDILHCHDWSTAHVAKSYWEDYHPYGLPKPKVIFTIHNLNYGQKKLMEAAHFCQKFTTVSPTYAFETGGTDVIAPHIHKFCGIRNGIDQDIWDPEHNEFLPAPISSEKVAEGKAAARAELRKRMNLTSWGDKLIVAVVSRLTPQKGVHLIKHTAYRAIDRGGQFVLLGSAPDPKVQEEFEALAQSMSGSDASFAFKYDEPLSHLIYAAADLIVVPSMFEPCGLTQMIAMRYGAIPVVRHTGGLKDTVFDVDFDKGRAAWELYGSTDWWTDGVDATNGFAFEGTDELALDYALNRAIDAWYNDRAWFHSLQRRVMEQDWSWNRPALDYIELYFAAIKQ